ncbi:peptidoglycan DD-metalloendopeptidase family protein [Staphylococcus arlettae]|uniref:peptidoglycan DD-metalloendopeptidase family protein n=1 Tax=Staphylococcus arlettae TaxID=29378 RepID=UPI002934C75C|nr:peptidoglycan DD-metalloendopeptidase family protein [Staphylococcus arlettae]
MAERIKGLSISLGLEENGIQKNVTDIKRSFRQLNTDLKLTDKIFNKSERTIEEYNAELDKLGTASKVLENNLNSLEGEMQSLDTTTVKGKRRATKLKNEYNKQAMAALRLEKRIDDLNDEYKDLSNSQKLLFSTNSKAVRSFQAIQGRIQATNQRMNKLGDSFRNFGYVVRGMGMGALISNLSAIVPIGGSAISVLAGIGGAATAASGGVVGLAGAYGIAYAGIGAFAAQAGTALKMVEDGEMKATAELDRYQSSLTGLQNQWKGLVQSNQASIFNTMSNGIGAARVALTKLTPFITDTTNRIAKMSKRMRDWVTSSHNATTAFKLINNIGPPIFQNILNSIFKVTDGLVHMGNQFAPLFTWVGQGLENMAVKFNAWANSASTDNGIARFIEYTKTNLPIVGQIFGNIFSGIISLFQAFAGHSHTVMQGMAGVTNTFKEWAASLSGTQSFKNFIAYLNANGPKVWQVLKNIGSILVSVVQGMAPIGAFVLDLTMKFTGFISKLTEGNPIFGRFIGILSMMVGSMMAVAPMFAVLNAGLGPLVGWLIKVTGVAKLIGPIMGALTGPIGWVTLGIVALGTALVVAYKKSETFRNIVNGMVTGVVNGFKLLWSGIMTVLTPIGQAFMKFGQQIKQTIGDFWAKHGSQFMQAINNIKNGFFAFWEFIQPVLGFIGGLFKSTFSDSIPIINFFKNLIMGSLVHAFNMVKNTVMIAFNAVKGIIMGVLNVVMGFVKVFIGIFTGDWKLFGEGLKQIATSFLSILNNLFQLAFAGILGIAKTIWGVIKNTIVGLARGIWTGVKNALTWLKNSIVAIFNSVRNFTINIWNYIKNKVVGFASSLWSGVKARFNSLKNAISYIFNSVRNFLYGLWTAVRNKVVSLAQSLYSRAKSIFNNLKNSITSIFNSVRSFLYGLWKKVRDKVVSIATSLYNGVRSKFNDLKNSVKNIIGKVKNNLYDTWDNIWNKVTDVASSLKDKVTGTFGKMRDVLSDIIGKIKGFIDDMVDKVKKGLNKLIGGVNAVGDKLGMGKEVIKPIKLSTGTESTHSQNFVSNGAISKPTMAVVNDKGPGNGSGPNGHQELIQRKDGSLYAPQGRNTLVGLDKGDKVINGRDTQRAKKQGLVPNFSKGTGSLPHFSEGTGVFDWIGDKLGDIWDYAKDPSKLLNKIIEKMGINFDFLGKGTIPGELMKGMFKKIKKGAADLIKSWFEAQEGGDGSVLDMSKLTYKYGNDPNYYRETGVKWHSGLDFNYINEKLPSTINGTAKVMPFNGSGYGNWVKIIKGAMEVIYAHLSKHTLKDGEKVKIGDTVGISGNTGFSTGPHLHYEMRKNGKAFDPLPWLKENNGGGKGASYTKNIIKQAQSILGGEYKSSSITDHMMALAKRESNYDPEAVNNWDINAMMGTPSKGLFQMIEPTFMANAKKGHKNFNSPLDQAISSMRYIVKTYGWGGFGRAAARAYKTGGIINSEGLYNLAEDGHSEVVVPLDPARANDAMKLIGYAQSKVKDKKNKRPNDVSNKYSSQSNDSGNTNLLMQMIVELQEQNGYLKEIVRSNQSIEEQPKGYNEEDVSHSQGKRSRMTRYNYGIAGI